MYKSAIVQAVPGWYDVQRQTIFSWFTRLDTDESLEQAVIDFHISKEN